MKVRLDGRPRESFEHLLAELELGDDIEGHAHDDPERSEPDDCSIEADVRALDMDERTVCADEIDRCDRGRERLVAGA